MEYENSFSVMIILHYLQKEHKATGSILRLQLVGNIWSVWLS